MTNAGYLEQKVLDHGYIRLVTTWGSDQEIIESARMSTQKGFEGWGPMNCWACSGETTDERETRGACVNCKGTGQVAGDERLLKYLWKNKHATPFEMAGATFEMQAPIFVFREWHRHRTQSYSEASARYTPLPAFDYLPTVERCLVSGGSNKQARGAGDVELTREHTEEWLKELAHLQRAAERTYQAGLRVGVPKELARLALTVGRYSRQRASANLRNWLAFLALRDDSHAQHEIRVYAQALRGMLSVAFPRTLQVVEEVSAGT